MKYNKLCIALMCTAAAALAITFGDSTATNPITGNPVKVKEVASSGTYVYRWPSRYDLVFAPTTYEEWVWFDPESGYGAFNGDFEKLSTSEIARLRLWLAKSYDPKKPPLTHLDRLRWLGRIYEQRDKDDTFWRWYNRLMVYMLRDNPAGMQPYLKAEIALMEKHLPEAKELERHEVLWVLGEYHRRLGDFAVARTYFDQLRVEPYKDESGTTQKGVPYFLEMLKTVDPLLDAKDMQHPALKSEASNP